MVNVLITGATGRMGVALREALDGQWSRVRLYCRNEPEQTFSNEEVIIGDLSEFEKLCDACEGIDVIVHLAGIADEADFDEILQSNIAGTHALYEAARTAGVRRVVFASSNHATGYYPVTESITGELPPRPDSYYGVSKVFGEALGRLYHDKWGLEVVNLRIGSFRPEPEDIRQLSIWLSHRDGAELIRCAVETSGFDWLTIYGVSANTRSFWRNEHAAEILGFVPKDNAEDFAAGILGETIYPFQGGIYATPEYRGGTWVARKDV